MQQQRPSLAAGVRSVQGFTLAPMAGNLVLSERLDDGVHLITLNKPCVHVLYRCRLPALRVWIVCSWPNAVIDQRLAATTGNA